MFVNAYHSCLIFECIPAAKCNRMRSKILIGLLMLQETILKNLHSELGGKLVDFGGWLMPLHYGSQIEEHHAVRKDAGMFDVSHMTVIDVAGAEAKAYLQHVLANDVDRLKIVGKALYSGMLNTDGGVIDDLIVYLMDDGYRLVVNCATRDKDLAWLELQAKDFDVDLKERADFAMIAVQGPNARAKVDSLLNIPELGTLKPFQGLDTTSLGKSEWFVARTGYTGEDGYEVIMPQAEAEQFWRDLLKLGVASCGLASRDTLRLEAGMNLYGHEMDDEISPLVANMAWTVAWEPSDRNFIGRSALQVKKEGGVAEKLVGLVLQAKGVMRAGQEVIIAGEDAKGVVTSGTFSPTLGHSIALARVPISVGAQCEVQIRNKRLTVDVVAPNFVRHGKKVF